MAEFVHLHLHSEYSLLDGACRVKDIPAAVKAAGQSAVALTDHGNLFGAVAFYEACKAENVKPIIGCEVYVAPRDRTDREGFTATAKKYYHLVLLCENEQGYENLIKLVTAGYTEGFYARPRIDLSLLREHREGLIALSGCMAGYLAGAILRDDLADACEHARFMEELMGKGNYFIELQDHSLPTDGKLLRGLLQVSAKTGVPVVATNDVHYLRKEEADLQQLLTCIGTATTVEEGRPDSFSTDEFYLKDADEMAERFASVPEAMENTVRIAERCQFDFTFGELHLPTYPLPEGVTAQKELQRLAEEGLRRRTEAGELDLTNHTAEDYKFRMIYEMMIISKMGYCDYYLIVRDFVTAAKEMGVPTGPGRGSGAGSLVAWLVGITEIDSIRYNLLFERFLNPERVSMPDFDVDFCYERRDEVIAYVTKKYGRDHVSQIAAFGTLAARAAVRDVGRALGLNFGEVDRVASLIPRDLGITIKDALARSAELRTAYQNEEKVRQLIDFSMAVEGMPRHITIHAAGIVITEKPLDHYLPLVTSGDAVLTQYDMNTVAKLGLLKFDFLALRYLTIIADTEKLIRRTEPDFRVDKVSLDDPEAYALLCAGDTDGVFQLESAGMKRLLGNMRPRCIEDVMVAIALYRPGPMESIPQFLRNRNDPAGIKKRPEGVAEILADTAGCIVYQEQVMQIFRKVAGYSFGKADVVRRAMAKKHPEQLEKERSTFLAGAAKNFVPEAEANALFDEMANFASYAFNKSHAAAYSYLAYRTAYLKAHYRAAYEAALLSSVLGNPVKTADYIADCASAGIRVLAPDINRSDRGFSVAEGNILFGLGAIKGVGDGLADALITERREGGEYTDFESFLRRMSGKGLNKQALQSLIWAGCFDAFPQSRSQLAVGSEGLLSMFAGDSRRNLDGQMDLFAEAGAPAEFVYPDLPEYPARLRLLREKEVTGLCFSGNLMDGYTKAVAALRATPIAAILQAGENAPDEESEYPTVRDKDELTVCGVVTRRVIKKTKRDEEYCFLTVEDPTGSLELLFFHEIMQRYLPILREDNALGVTGTLSLREDESPKLIVSAVQLLPEDDPRSNPPDPESRMAAEAVAEAVAKAETEAKAKAKAAPQKSGGIPVLYLRLPTVDERNPLCRRVNAVLSIFEGPVRAVLYSEETKTYTPSPLSAAPTPFVLGELRELLGEANVILREHPRKGAEE